MGPTITNNTIIVFLAIYESHLCFKIWDLQAIKASPLIHNPSFKQALHRPAYFHAVFYADNQMGGQCFGLC
jgi:hypothetical protein